MSVTFHGVTFDGPFTSTDYIANAAGVYLILRQEAPSNYHVIDIGESGTVQNRLRYHEREGCWVRHGFTHYAVHWMPGSDEHSRRLLESALRAKAGKLDCGEY